MLILNYFSGFRESRLNFNSPFDSCSHPDPNFLFTSEKSIVKNEFFVQECALKL